MKLLGVCVAASLALAGCGGDTGGEETAPAEQETASPSRNIVEVGVTEYAFEMPDSVTGGTVTFSATNTGSQPHEMGFAALEEGRDADDVARAIARGEQPDWAEDLAGIPVISPGIEASMTRELDEGMYVFLCFLPTPEGQPHAAEGMVKVFEITGTSDAEGPEPDLTITATDDGFEVPDITAGTYDIELVNDGTKEHEFAFISFDPGKGEKDLGRWFNSGYEGEAPALFPGGIQTIEPGTSVVIGITFESGRTYRLEDYPSKLSTEIVIE